MKGAYAFDPVSGAQLSEERNYTTPSGHSGTHIPGHVYVSVRTPVDCPRDREGMLTNGEIVSAGTGLLGYFRTTHRRVRPPVPKMDSAAALALKRLKAADDPNQRGDRDPLSDAFLWLALAERLAAKGYWAGWMLDQFTPRCPHCDSTLKFRDACFEADARCASYPNEHGTVNEAIREKVSSVYKRTFGETLTPHFV